MGMEGLMEEDQYLAEVNLEDLESTTGERQEYWLVAIYAARQAYYRGSIWLDNVTGLH